ncbi:hypothetical protein LCGC14_2833720, partial [marine sediment metagenome]
AELEVNRVGLYREQHADRKRRDAKVREEKLADLRNESTNFRQVTSKLLKSKNRKEFLRRLEADKTVGVNYANVVQYVKAIKPWLVDEGAERVWLDLINLRTYTSEMPGTTETTKTRAATLIMNASRRVIEEDARYYRNAAERKVAQERTNPDIIVHTGTGQRATIAELRAEGIENTLGILHGPFERIPMAVAAARRSEVSQQLTDTSRREDIKRAKLQGVITERKYNSWLDIEAARQAKEIVWFRVFEKGKSPYEEAGLKGVWERGTRTEMLDKYPGQFSLDVKEEQDRVRMNQEATRLTLAWKRDARDVNSARSAQERFQLIKKASKGKLSDEDFLQLGILSGYASSPTKLGSFARTLKASSSVRKLGGGTIDNLTIRFTERITNLKGLTVDNDKIQVII